MPGKMILLVEDDPVTAKLMARALEQIGADVTICGDGREAFMRSQRLRPTS